MSSILLVNYLTLQQNLVHTEAGFQVSWTIGRNICFRTHV